MGHADLKVIEGGTSEGGTGKGSEAWATRVRKDAKTLSRDIDKAYIELAELLYTIYDMPAYNDKMRGPVFTVFWGHKSFADYVQEELGIHHKRAQRLTRIWHKLGIQLSELDGDLKKRIVALGFSKVRELVRVLTYKNALSWVEKAEQMSYLKLCKAIEQYVAARDLRDAQRAAEAGVNGSSPLPTSEAALLEGTPTVSYSGSSYVGDPCDDDEEDIPVPDIKPEEISRRTFDFYPDQLATVEQAIQRSAQLSNSDKRSHNISLICLDFLATNDFAKADETQRLRFLQKFEKLLGYKLIIVDSEANEVVYGIDTLTKLAHSE